MMTEGSSERLQQHDQGGRALLGGAAVDCPFRKRVPRMTAAMATKPSTTLREAGARNVVISRRAEPAKPDKKSNTDERPDDMSW
jgi:hypothetical protein